MSGASLLRPGIQQLLIDGGKRQFDVVYAEALDRISRDQEDVAAVFKRLQFVDVPIVTVAEGLISELHVGLKGTMNALYLKDLAEKTRRGLRGRVEAGHSGGGNSYGYDVIVGTVGNEIERGERRINTRQAEIILRIFTEYAAGVSPRSIAKKLNQEGMAGPSGADWGPSTINGNASRGTGILNNELYVGRMVWNRLAYRKDPETGKRRSRLNPASEWILKEVPDLRIVPDDLWHAVKERQKASHRETRPDKSSVAFLEPPAATVSVVGSDEVRLVRSELHEVRRESLWMCGCPIQGHMFEYSSPSMGGNSKPSCSTDLNVASWSLTSSRSSRESSLRRSTVSVRDLRATKRSAARIGLCLSGISTSWSTQSSRELMPCR